MPQAVALCDELTVRSRSEKGAPFLHGALCLALGKVDRAFELLDRAYETRDTWCLHMRTPPYFDTVSSDPRFQEILSRMNFPK